MSYNGQYKFSILVIFKDGSKLYDSAARYEDVVWLAYLKDESIESISANDNNTGAAVLCRIEDELSLVQINMPGQDKYPNDMRMDYGK